MKKRVILVISVILLVSLVVGLIVVTSQDKEGEEHSSGNIENVGINENEQQENIAPSRLDDSEKNVSEKKKQELFNYIPKVYVEQVAPFDSSFMLDAVMKKIID